VPSTRSGATNVVLPRLVRAALELARALVRAAPDHDPVPFPEHADELVGRRRAPPHLRLVGDELVGAEDVVGISGSGLGHLVVEHDPLGFVRRELGAFDEVREVGLPAAQTNWHRISVSGHRNPVPERAVLPLPHGPIR